MTVAFSVKASKSGLAPKIDWLYRISVSMYMNAVQKRDR
jgi:hypothetical protein